MSSIPFESMGHADHGEELDDEAVAREFLYREHFALRQEILQRLSGTADIEKTALLSTAAIYAFLIGFDSSKLHFKFVELMLWWVPFFAMLFSWSKIKHYEKRLRQISQYLHKIELQLYGVAGYSRNQLTTRGWETELRAPGNEQDFVMALVESVFWRTMILLSFVVALVKTLTETGVVDVQIDQLNLSNLSWTYFNILLDFFRRAN